MTPATSESLVIVRMGGGEEDCELTGYWWGWEGH